LEECKRICGCDDDIGALGGWVGKVGG